MHWPFGHLDEWPTHKENLGYLTPRLGFILLDGLSALSIFLGKCCACCYAFPFQKIQQNKTKEKTKVFTCNEPLVRADLVVLLFSASPFHFEGAIIVCVKGV